MPRTIADYITPQKLKDDSEESRTLNPEGRRDTSFELPLPADADVSQHTVLAFTLHATDPDDLRVVVNVGSEGHMTNVWDFRINSNVLHTVHQIVPTDKLKAGVDNFCDVHVHEGGGQVTFGNVVLWFQRFDEK
jgi:hypothetical protein